jgi:hypothetical protein
VRRFFTWDSLFIYSLFDVICARLNQALLLMTTNLNPYDPFVRVRFVKSYCHCLDIFESTQLLECLLLPPLRGWTPYRSR